MKYCSRCGTEIADDARFCHNCGAECMDRYASASAVQGQVSSPVSGIRTAAKVFMVLEIALRIMAAFGALICILAAPELLAFDAIEKSDLILYAVIYGIGPIITLAWCVPMTRSYFDKVKKGESVSFEFKMCTLLFVSLIAGILMFCDNNK